MSSSPGDFDLLIVGAGPGGIAAAVTAVEGGQRVCLVDDGAFAGGQIWRNRGEKPRDSQASYWIERLSALADKITWHRQSRVVARPAQSTLLVETPSAPIALRFKSLILATGARELFLPFPGWTLPGVVGAGAMQALVKQGLSVRGKRIVVAGTGPLLLAVADMLRSKGAIVPIILEQAPSGRINRFAVSLISTPSKLLAGVALRARLLGTRYATDSYPTAVTRDAAGLIVQYRRAQAIRSIPCDYVACGFNLIPNNELPQLLGCQLKADGFVQVDRQLLTNVSNVYAIGELTGIGGVEKAIIEGCIAAYNAIGDEIAAARWASERTSAMRFVRSLAAAFALRPELSKLAAADTIVCRCEDVALSAVQGAMSGRDAKLQTRCGMGPCQGRVCGPILQHLLGSEPPQIRPPILPTSIGTLIAETA